MDMNSIESNTLAAMVVEQDLLEWLQQDESVEMAEESKQTASGHA